MNGPQGPVGPHQGWNQPQWQAGWQIPPPQPPRKSHTALIVSLVAAGVVLLVVLGIGVWALAGPAQRALNTQEATSTTSFDAVCDGGAITNAAAYAKPHTFLAFGPSSFAMIDWSAVTLPTDPKDVTDKAAIGRVDAVACLTEVSGAATKSMTCEFDDNGSKVTADYYSTRYDVTVYEAKTGRKVGRAGTVDATASSCPIFASFSRNDRRFTATASDNDVQRLLAAFTG
ncbi:hypothetical protein P0W64_17560 [Tsukamurella sp. 8F]|uniref:hypothetical protein n=1 Tax=unclassified Tsukamurella TaxID=2633480 RepID=UPI0023B9CB1C|nr:MULTISPECIES: hypothetical protein [unclassified Tsukamurella]MDF0530275.1 hypothetical protein [Tsukamurella sp. 8J]MDF0588593.1 hypothetical protein [Tsukamurella sp. 8F]